MAESGEISIALTPIQLYAILNGKSISQGELASNSWHEMPGPPRGSELARLLQPMSAGDTSAQIRQFLAQNGSSAPSPTSSRQDAWTHQSHYSQPNAPECWIPPAAHPPSRATMNRVVAGLEIVGAGLEMTAGVLLILTPEPTMVTKVGGGILTAHGADFMQAAVRQLFSGKPVADMTERGTTWAAHKAGASDRAAHRIGVVMDVAVSFTDLGLGIYKLVAIRAGRAILSEEAIAGKVGRVTIAEEEANKAIGKAGGHTGEVHVDVDDPFLEKRANAAKDPARIFSRFTDRQAAEDAINECIRVNRKLMQNWAANPSLAPEFEIDLGRTIGRGYSRASGNFTEFSKVRVVLRAAKTGPKKLFIITSYPIP